MKLKKIFKASHQAVRDLAQNDPSVRYFHFSYHKCMTVYFSRVMRGAMPGRYAHFQSRLDDFYQEAPHLHAASINNHLIDFDRLPPFRASHFIRDPRDLVVSGYFYHKRAAEPWCEVVDPTDADWAIVNGVVPEGLAAGESYASFLQRVDAETGLAAEIAFRRRHFEAMANWPYGHAHVLELRYEDVLGCEIESFEKIARFYEFEGDLRRRFMKHAQKFALSFESSPQRHVRDPKAGQWQEHFTDRLKAMFKELYPGLVPRLGYARDDQW